MRNLFFFFLFFCYCITVNGQNNHPLFINEIIASNSGTLMDETGSYEDWIEIYNPNSYDINIANYFITDDLNNPTKFKLPSDTVITKISTGGFLIIWASGSPQRGPLHTNFSLSIQGEQLGLVAPDGVTFIDSLSFGNQLTDVSFGRKTDGGSAWAFFEEPTPEYSNSFSKGYNEILSPPIFSHEAGFYTDSFSLTISHPDPDVIIIYTLDGSEPDTANLNGKSYIYKNSYPVNPGNPFGDTLITSYYSYIYTNPVLITDRSGLPNYLCNFSSTIQTLNYIPANPIPKATILRAKTYKPGTISREISTKSYFVSEQNLFETHLPVISLAIQEDDLFSYEYGIYTAGEDYDKWRLANPSATQPADPYARPGNFHRESEFSLNFEYFSNKNPILNLLGGFRINGNYTRSFPIKSLRLYARNRYGDTEFNYSFFPGLSFSSFKTLLLRNSGNDFSHTYFRDAFVQTCVKHLNIGVQAYQPSIVFLNGEFWGVHNLRERIDKYYIFNHFAVNADEIDFINVKTAEEGDMSHYNETLEYIKINGIKDSANFHYINKRIDIENFTDYQITEIYIRNTDWPGNNIRYWRKKTEFDPLAAYGHDGKWRWILFDTDFGFGLTGGSTSYTHNTLAFATQTGGTEWPNPEWSTFLLRKFIENDDFKFNFINRFADLINTTFLPNRVLFILDSLKNQINAEMHKHIERWKYPLDINTWENRVNTMRNFAQQRPFYMRQHIRTYFNLPNEHSLTLNISEYNGFIKINTIDIIETTPGVKQNPYPWSGIYFEEVPITLTAKANKGYNFSHWEINDSMVFQNPLILNLKDSTYALAVFVVDSAMLPALEISAESISCNGENDGKVIASVTGQAPFQISWSTGKDTIIGNLAAHWDFNGVVPSDSPSVSLGSGNAILIGGTTNPSSNLNGNGSSDTASSNQAWQTTGYPAQGQNPKTAGVQFNISTEGFKNIHFSFDQRLSNSAANTWVLQYCSNVDSSAPDWKDANTFYIIPMPTGTGDTWHNGRSFNFSAISELANNPYAGFRIVSDFDPDSAKYVAARSTSAYNGGTSRFDMVKVSGDPIVVLSPLEPGTYSVTITDANGFQITDSTVVSEPPALVHSIVKTDVRCYGNNDGNALISISGGTPPYNYFWSNGDSLNQINLAAGEYEVNITDSNGCSLSDSVFIYEPSEMNISLTANHPDCNGADNGLIETNISGGIPPYIFNWNTGDTSHIFQNLSAGTYILTVKDTNECEMAEQIILTEPPPVLSNFTFQTNQLEVQFANNSTGNSSYLWEFGDGNSSTIPQPVHIYSLAGSYQVCLTVFNICDTITFCDSLNVYDTYADEKRETDNYIIYPNPTKDEITIEFGNNKNLTTFYLLNNLGEVIEVFENTSQSFNINLSPYSGGVYFIRLLDDKGNSSVKKIIVIR
jgi:PKD repeat protein